MNEAQSWFDDARFGLFVHWSHCSQAGLEVSWPMVGGVAALPQSQRVTVAQYESTAPAFDPQRWDARALARTAKRCGMRYAVLTAKHHDGYAMFDTRLSDYSIMRSPFGRDVVREFVEAMRAEGIRAGLYFSLIDWHHPDYPAWKDDASPYVFGKWQPPDERWPRFTEFMFGQIRELLTNYGRIDLLWFDGGWERTAEQWRTRDLVAMIRGLQPGIIINDRLPGAGDYATPEQFIPPQPPAGLWETCMTMNESWGYNPDDGHWKSARSLIHMLCEVAARGGNLLLNVGPRGDGALPAEAQERLDAIAAWMARNGESIAGTRPGLEPWQWYGPSTRRGDMVYAHLLARPYDTVTVRGVRVKRVRRVRALGTGAELRFSVRTSIIDRMYNPDPVGEVTITVPPEAVDEHATVLAIELATPAWSSKG